MLDKFFDIFYNAIFIPIAKLIIIVLKNYIPKLSEREKYVRLNDNFSEISTDNKYTIWFHSASMGEFEQAKPIIEKLKTKYPKIFIVVSFFSPSGFNTQKNYSYADYICYLPFDSQKNVTNFIQKIKPDIAVFVRYEIWRNYLKTLKLISIPILLIDATKPSNSFFRNFLLSKLWIRSNMNYFNEIITVGEIHTTFFESLKLKSTKVTTLTDTRFDRICEFVLNAKKNHIIPSSFFHGKELVLVAGSIWEQDENILIGTYNNLSKIKKNQLRIIFVPHEPTQENLLRLTSKLDSYQLLSEIIKNNPECLDSEILSNNSIKNIVVDSIGFLLRLYNHGSFVYIGGAFGAGVHSVTEPAGYGLPIATGPDLSKSVDAQNLKDLGALTIINNQKEFQNWLEKMIDDSAFRENQSEIAKNYIFKNIGSTDKVIKIILNYMEDKK